MRIYKWKSWEYVRVYKREVYEWEILRILHGKGRNVWLRNVISHSQHHLPFFFSFRGAIVFPRYY